MTRSDPSSASSSAPVVTAEGEAFPSAPARLRYVEVGPPAPGTSVAIAPGVLWARIPLPIELSHINVWLLETEQGYVVVDTGMAAMVGKEAWLAIERDVFAKRKVCAVFVTHIHPDHIGLSAWLQERHRVPVMMSERTHELSRTMLGGESKLQPAEVEKFFSSQGLSDLSSIQPMLKPDRFARITSGVPSVERHVADGETLQWGSGWTAMRTDGHAEGHLCLWNAAHRVLISGDQVLPTISSNISFGPHTADLNPLGSYLSSLERLRKLPADTLVLPSHGVPFYGLQQRTDDLRDHHAEELTTVLGACREPKSAAELLPFMFRRELKGMHLFLALGEALAHAEHLVHAGKLRRENPSGITRYRSD
jgi:glyoxylase-like metal-dependent hydrolase (beta-lactamase superfamily II)